MTAVTNLSDIANRLTGGNSGAPQHAFAMLDGRIQSAAAAAPVINRWTSLWQYNKTDGSNGAVPTTVLAPGKATIGATPLADPGSGKQQWLLGVEGILSQAGSLLTYDRLLQIGGLSGTVTTPQTVGGTLTRYNTNATCVGNQIWVEINTAIGATGTTITASYTNQAGTAGRTTKPVSIGATGLNEVQRFIPLMLADGDSGVQAVASVTLAGTTGTAGNFGVIVIHPLITSGGAASQSFVRDAISGLPTMPEIITDACVAHAFLASATTAIAGLIALHTIDN